MSKPVNCGTSFCSCIECVDEAKLNRADEAEEFDNWCKESDDGAEEEKNT